MEDGRRHLSGEIKQSCLPPDPRWKTDRSKPGAEAARGQRSCQPLARKEPGGAMFVADDRMLPALVDELENKAIEGFGQLKGKLLELQGDAPVALDYVPAWSLR
ncbi:hypothetical protein AB0467_28395 [Streptomyces sp. NPDC052095]|uniref:hypothetical protein n=1 Tax=unclassified Streptomyces TaxID=2593676 RepID=UPI0034507893